jgi:hypothetical protein
MDKTTQEFIDASYAWKEETLLVVESNLLELEMLSKQIELMRKRIDLLNEQNSHWMNAVQERTLAITKLLTEKRS